MLLDRYIGNIVLRAFLLIAAGLTALFSLLVFVEQLGLVGQGRYRITDAIGNTLLTAPDRLLQLAPVSMLLAVLLGLGHLARGWELTAFRSFGVSEVRIVGAVLKLCVPVVLALFLLAQFIIPPAQLEAQREQAGALGNALPGLSGGGFWAEKQDHQFLNVRRFSGGDTLRGVSLYRFNPDGTLALYVQAAEARIAPDGSWWLRGVLRKQIRDGQIYTDYPASLSWAPFLSGQQLRLLAIPPQTMPPLALFAYIRELRREHQQALFYEQSFWSMVAIPISLLAMALIAARFVFGSERASGAGWQMLLGGVLGMVFLLVQEITGYLGLLLDINPAISALAPSMLLLALSVWLLERKY